ncbi:hypothetical protein F5Y14DRAFT_446459 [Nemania sp. NC0429]|nr:hypothetical protein F5Y14DRAFT_446459 [Nemania sp. NC0429]
MSEQETTTAESSRTGSNRAVFRPVKTHPDETATLVRRIFKHDQTMVENAAGHLAPLFGLGPTSAFDLVARSRAQAIFVCPEITKPLEEFRLRYTRDSWDLPLASWAPTLALVNEFKGDKAWLESPSPTSVKASPEHHYARFLIRVLAELEGYDTQSFRSRYMLKWLRQADCEEDVVWVFFYALMYLQLVAMHFNRAKAPFERVARYYAHKLVDYTVKFVAARKGIDEIKS